MLAVKVLLSLRRFDTIKNLVKSACMRVVDGLQALPPLLFFYVTRKNEVGRRILEAVRS